MGNSLSYLDNLLRKMHRRYKYLQHDFLFESESVVSNVVFCGTFENKS